MYAGRLIEIARTNPLFGRPLHPYTEALLSVAPKPDPRVKTGRILLAGEVPDPANVPAGCALHPRCSYAQEACKSRRPPLRQVEAGRYASCHFAGELDLAGVP